MRAPLPSWADPDDPACQPAIVFEDSRSLLGVLEEEIRRIKEMLDSAYDDAVAAKFQGKDQQRYFNAAQNLSTLVDRYMKERERVERDERDREMSEAWQAETEKEAARLLAYYARYGPHYVVLCEALAPLVVKLRKSHAGGIRLTPGEQTDLTRTAMNLVGQLQKHTESTKTESTLTSEIAVKVLGIVEHHVSNQPELWQRIVKSVRGQIEQPALTGGTA